MKSKKNKVKYRIRKPELIPLLFIIGAEVLLIGLGVWQMQRLHWKTSLIERVETAMAEEPIAALPQDTKLYPDYEYRRVRIQGTYQYPQTLRMIGSKTSGYYLLTPLVLPSGKVVMINRGWAPSSRVGVIDDARGYVEGFMRLPREARMFSPDNQPQKNVWFTEDIPAMSHQTGFALEPIIVESMGPQNASGVPRVSDGKIKMRNDHLGYAITWFLIALIGLVMFFYFYREPVKEKKEGEGEEDEDLEDDEFDAPKDENTETDKPEEE